MKKSLIIFSLCFLLLIGFVSGFSFSDFFEKFTGKVVDYSGQPYCSGIGTRSESWRNSERFIKYDSCGNCEAVCKPAKDKKVEGWYSSCDESLILEEDCDCADTCLNLGYECGVQDVCGENINCGKCSSGFLCFEGICEECVPETKNLKALAVIVDFQNKKLEDYGGEGINSFSDFRNILDKMEAHWEWMSVGNEKIDWDIIRVTIPHDLTGEIDYPYSYEGNLVYFQGLIIKLAEQEVDNKLYDNNCDGNIDNIFAIISSEDKDASNSEYHYIVGGASNELKTKIFMDPQGSRSVRDEVYGNFNHELGHGHKAINNFLGLPDIYGKKDTLGYLSLMSDSWLLPAVSFSAYDRYLLEWINPKGISTTLKDRVLFPAEENLQAVKILTDNSKEFFLVEYRKKPEEGFGSAKSIPDYNGLAIYHVYEEVFWDYPNDGFPPLLYLEPADGENSFPSAPQAKDFWSPDNLQSSGIFEAKKWNSEEVIFKIENLRWSGEGILFDVNFDEAGIPLNEVEVIEKLKIKNFSCQEGCSLNKRCYQLGDRQKGRFCSEKGIFVKQFKEENSCENNFECGSNVCGNKNCISGNLVQRMFNWFRRIFGGE